MSELNDINTFVCDIERKERNMLKKIMILSLVIVLTLAVFSGCENKEKPSASGPETEESMPEESAEQAGTDADLYSKYLTAADVEEVTGIGGLTSMTESITLKFFTDEGLDILEVRFDGSSFYDEEVGANEEYYSPVSDLGDKAAICIPDMPYRVTFLQGDHCIMVQTIPQDGNLPVTEDQLIALAKIVSSRL